MRPASVTLGVAGAALLVPIAANAQLGPRKVTGSLISVQPKTVDEARARAIRKGFAQCVFRVSKAKAKALLEHSDPGEVDLAAAKITNPADDLKMSKCLGGEVGLDQLELGMRLSRPFLRDLLAEEAYLAVTPSVPQLPAAPVPPVPTTYVSTVEKLTQAKAMMAFSDCSVVNDVAHADGLLRTLPGSIEEREAARALAPALGRCLRQGQQVSLSAVSIRAFIAYAMWNRFGRKADQ